MKSDKSFSGASALKKASIGLQVSSSRRFLAALLAIALCLTGVPLLAAAAQLTDSGNDLSESLEYETRYQIIQDNASWSDVEQDEINALLEEDEAARYKVVIDWNLEKAESISKNDHFIFRADYLEGSLVSQALLDSNKNIIGEIEVGKGGLAKATIKKIEAEEEDQEEIKDVIDPASGSIELEFGPVEEEPEEVILQTKNNDTPQETTSEMGFFSDPVPYAPTGDPNDAPQYGQISLVKFKQAANGKMGGMVLDTSGRIWVFGYNLYGELGIGGVAPEGNYYGGMKRVQYFIDNNITINEIGATYETRFALSDTGDVYSWGEGGAGARGDGTTTLNGYTPQRILSGIKHIYAADSYVHLGAGFALGEDNRLWAWGNNTNGRLGIGSNTNSSNPQEVSLTALDSQLPQYARDAGLTFASGTREVVKVTSGRAASFILDNQGDLWAAGSDQYGDQGNGTSGGGSNVFRLMDNTSFGGGSTADSHVKIIDVDAAYSLDYAGDRVVAATAQSAWEWGTCFGSNGGGNNTKTVPDKVGISASEIAAYGYTPIPVSVTASERVNAFVDQYGRSWMWGEGFYFGFGREGGYENANAHDHIVRSNAAEQWPKIIGDGDTQIYDTSEKFPRYTGKGNLAVGGATATQNFGYGFNGLHPTIYDEKYMLQDANGFVLDEEGNRLKYAHAAVVDGVNGLTIGLYYKVNASGGIDSARETAIPAIDPIEYTWIRLAFKDTPYITSLDISHSAYAFLDSDGNLFKWGNDGSGAIAWGWDWEYKYDNEGGQKPSANPTVGLADRYCYEVMYMRGAPTIDNVDMRTGLKNKVKVYKDPVTGDVTNTAEIKLHIPANITSTELGAGVHSDVNELMYVIVPYDTSDSSFSADINTMTYDQFMDLYNTSDTANKGSLINSPILSGSTAQDLSYEVNMPNNGRLIAWAVNERYVDAPDGGKEYVNINQISSAFVADNVYTPVSMNHKGVGIHFDDSELDLYDPTIDNVVKTNNDSADTGKPFDETLYGLPLDAANEVIGATKASDGTITVDPAKAPTYGYDTTQIKSYEEVGNVGIPSGILPYWKFKSYMPGSTTELQPTLVNKDMNDKDLLNTGYAHTFYYEPNADYWTTVSGEKTWEDNSDKLGFRPDKISLTLKQYERDTTTGDKGNFIKDIETIEVTPDAQGRWTFDFGWQMSYEFTYEVVETPIPVYTTEITYPNLVTGGSTNEDFSDISIVNTLDMRPVKFNKVDSDKNPIVSDSAIFVLTNATAGGKVYDAAGDEQDSIQLSTSASDPYIVMPIQKPGDYLLTEKKAPAGYNLLTMPIEVNIDASGNPTATLGAITLEEVTLSGGEVDIYSKAFNITNKGASELPKAGGVGTSFLLVISSVVLLLAAFLIRKNKKQSAAM